MDPPLCSNVIRYFICSCTSYIFIPNFSLAIRTVPFVHPSDNRYPYIYILKIRQTVIFGITKV